MKNNSKKTYKKENFIFFTDLEIVKKQFPQYQECNLTHEEKLQRLNHTLKDLESKKEKLTIAEPVIDQAKQEEMKKKLSDHLSGKEYRDLPLAKARVLLDMTNMSKDALDEKLMESIDEVIKSIPKEKIMEIVFAKQLLTQLQEKKLLTDAFIKNESDYIENRKAGGDTKYQRYHEPNKNLIAEIIAKINEHHEFEALPSSVIATSIKSMVLKKRQTFCTIRTIKKYIQEVRTTKPKSGRPTYPISLVNQFDSWLKENFEHEIDSFFCN